MGPDCWIGEAVLQGIRGAGRIGEPGTGIPGFPDPLIHGFPEPRFLRKGS